MPKARLEINDYRCHARVGWGDAERARPQPMRFDVVIESPLPDACFNDELSNTICYDQLCQRIRAFVEDRDFKLIERMAFELHAALREFLKPDQFLSLKVTKLNPPIEGLDNASFEISS